jgi:predicted nucleotidyltransferase
MLAKHGCRLIALGIAYADSRQVPAVGRFAWHAAKSTVRLEVADPTAFPDLNAVLADFVASVEAILGENFCGAYLQGSFAVGDADVDSDVDYIVVTHDEVGDEQVAALQAMHERLYELETPWAQHLEGSYFPKKLLRRVGPTRAPLVYFDNGSTVPERDNHCNTAVVRLSLRERGVVLARPEPKSLIDPVSAGELRDEVRNAMAEWVEYASMPTKAGGMSQRLQSLIVLSFCRILQTLESGEVTSKKVAGEWALDALDPEWKGLIQQALTDRPDQWGQVHRPAAPEAAQRTFAFIDYAVRKASASG